LPPGKDEEHICCNRCNKRDDEETVSEDHLIGAVLGTEVYLVP
jgi:hypothetical protein